MTTILNTQTINWRGTQGTVCHSDGRSELPIGQWPTRMALRSHKTGHCVDVYLSGLHKDAEGDITHGVYRSVNFSQKMVLTVFND